MNPDLEARIERLENQVTALAHLVDQVLDLLRNAALDPWQRQERNRCEQLMQAAQSIKSRSPRS